MRDNGARTNARRACPLIGPPPSNQSGQEFTQLELFLPEKPIAEFACFDLAWVDAQFAAKNLRSFRFTDDTTPAHQASFWENCWETA